MSDKAIPRSVPLPAGIRLTLAPMAGVTDSPMRTVCGACGAGYAVTEMISAKALVYEQRSHAGAPAKTATLAYIDPDEKIPVAVQIFGSEPDFMADAAELISNSSYRGFSGAAPAAVDINMGCPVKKVVSNGEGSALMKDPEKIYSIVSSVCGRSSLPVTVKMRSGWDGEHVNAPECAVAAEAAGAAAVCVHARTREQFYRPGADISVIGETKAAVKIPVIGNGDIDSPEAAEYMLRQTGCDGIAIARAAIGDPWIFSSVRAITEGRPLPPSPAPREILDTALLQLRLSVKLKGERRGVAEVKFSLSHYLKGLPGSAAARRDIMSATSEDAAADVLRGFFGQFAGGDTAVRRITPYGLSETEK